MLIEQLRDKHKVEKTEMQRDWLQKMNKHTTKLKKDLQDALFELKFLKYDAKMSKPFDVKDFAHPEYKSVGVKDGAKEPITNVDQKGNQIKTISI